MAEYINSAGIAFNSYDKFILEVSDEGDLKGLYREGDTYNFATPVKDPRVLQIKNNTSVEKTVGALQEDQSAEDGEFAISFRSTTVNINASGRIQGVLDADGYIYLIMTSTTYNAAEFTNMNISNSWLITGTWSLYRFTVTGAPKITFN